MVSGARIVFKEGYIACLIDSGIIIDFHCSDDHSVWLLSRLWKIGYVAGNTCDQYTSRHHLFQVP